MVHYTITSSNLHIIDSWKVSKKDFVSTLKQIKSIHSKSNVWQRTMFSLKMEWALHNFLFRLGIYKTRTKDVDLDQPSDKPEWIYMILGVLSWPFIY